MTQRKASSKHEAMQICAHFALVVQATGVATQAQHSSMQIWQSSLCLVVLILSPMDISYMLYVCPAIDAITTYSEYMYMRMTYTSEERVQSGPQRNTQT